MEGDTRLMAAEWSQSVRVARKGGHGEQVSVPSVNC